MHETENLATFFRENKKLVKEYLDTRLEVYRLSAIRAFSKSSGYLLWILISLLLLSLFIIFLGLMTGFWLSEITGSYTSGFGFTSLIILFLAAMLAIFRKGLFINPIIRAIIRRAGEEPTQPE